LIYDGSTTAKVEYRHKSRGLKTIIHLFTNHNMKVDTTDIPIDVSFTKLANLKKKKNEIMKRYDWQI